MKIFTRITLDNDYADSVELGAVEGQLSTADKAKLRKHIDETEDSPKDITVRYEEINAYSSVEELIEQQY